MIDLPVLVLAGVGAGVVTTIAGMGGGLLLLLGLSLMWGPAQALTATAGALLLGNVHRVWLFRKKVDRAILGAFSAGAVPGALVGAVFAVNVSPVVIHVLMLTLCVVAVLKALGRLPWAPRSGHLVPGGAVIGTLTGAAGGAGVLSGPLFIAAGLEGEAYVATTSSAAALMHLSRMVGYGAGGQVTRLTLFYSALLAASIIVGNLLGRRARRFTERAPPRSIETATLVVCVVLAVTGVVR